MRELILKMSISVDGFVAGPGGEIDWIFKSFDPEGKAWTVRAISDASLHAMGARTYQDMAAHWPSSTEPFAPPMNSVPKVVFSRRASIAPSTAETTQALKDAGTAARGEKLAPSPEVAARQAEWASALVLHDLATDMARLKQADGKPIIAHGGASFAQALVATGLIDEYRLIVAPAALGRGLPLFSALAAPLDLKLISSTAFPAGAVAKVYRRA